MIRPLYAVARFWFRPTLKEWRRIRTTLMAKLPKVEKDADAENGK